MLVYMKENESMKARTIIVTSAFAMLMTAPVFAASPSNVFLSGKVFKGDEVITTFATPIVLGGTLPVNDQDSNGPDGIDTVRLALTPELSVENRVRVSIKAHWSVGAPSESVAGGMLNEKVELAQGESKTIPFGDCGYVDDKKSSCNYKLVLSASLQR